MIRIFSAIAASALMLGSIGAFGAELTSEERTELRQRAERLQAGEARAPAAQGDVKLNQNKSDVRLDQQRSEVKMKTAKAKKAKGVKAKPKANKKKRSIKDLPGALVR